MGVQESWFGPRDASLLGLWHIPAGDVARGAVVLCPPLGKETVHAYRMMVLAAQQLCAQGVAVLRFDYSGCGDSTGSQLAPDAVFRWQRDISIAVDYARSIGAREVALLGLRAGALLAATVAAQCGPLTAVALWDPVSSGRAYVREQQVLYRMKVGTGEEDRTDSGFGADAAAVSLLGSAMHPEAVMALKTLSLKSLSLNPLLIAARPERAGDPVLTALASRTGATTLAVAGHEQVFDVATFEIDLPAVSTAAVAAWLAERFSTESCAVEVPARRTAVVGSDETGHPVMERLVRLGPQRLFGVLTERGHGLDDLGRPAPLAIALPSSNEYRVGTGRIWVELARRLGSGGVSCVRFDRRGTGESGAVRSAERTPAYSAAAHEDLDAVIVALGRSPQRTALVGHCSGAWLAGEAASEGLARSVVLLGATRFAVGRQTEDWTPLDDPDRASVALNTRTGWAKAAIKRLLPGPTWRWMGRRGMANVPELLMRRLSAAGVVTTLVLAPVDHRHFVANRGRRAVERLRRGGWSVDVHTGRDGDHSLVHWGMRTASINYAVSAVLRDLLAPDNRPHPESIERGSQGPQARLQ